VPSTSGPRGSAVPFGATRRLALALVVVSLSLAGHASGHGTLPSSTGLLLATLIAGSLAFAATDRRRSLSWLVGFLLGAQLLIHVVLVVSSSHPVHGGGLMPLLPTGSMALGHLIATVVAAAVLARGEETLLAWATILSASFTWLVPTVVPPGDVAQPSADRDPWAPVLSDRGWQVDRRGPPASESA
jgi:hypothetical protein